DQKLCHFDGASGTWPIRIVELGADYTRIRKRCYIEFHSGHCVASEHEKWSWCWHQFPRRSARRLTSPCSGGAPHLRRKAAEPNASAPVGRVHFIVTRPLQRVVRRQVTGRSVRSFIPHGRVAPHLWQCTGMAKPCGLLMLAHSSHTFTRRRLKKTMRSNGTDMNISCFESRVMSHTNSANRRAVPIANT